jgi:uncharacterized membrane protein YfcA
MVSHRPVEQLAIAAAGVAVGGVFGVFGAGGSAVATPLLAALGVPGAAAVASPLPAMLPAAMAGARRHLRAGSLDLRVARLAVIGGLPGTILGALASVLVGGGGLLAASGVLLLVVGARVLLPDRRGHGGRAAVRRGDARVVVGASFAVGVVTGLLANGGGFLLVPLFVLVLGLGAREATGTSMVAVAALTVPTIAMHSALGHVDWAVALAFAVGVLPGSLAGTGLAERLPAAGLRRAFGALLVAFAAWFLLTT